MLQEMLEVLDMLQTTMLQTFWRKSNCCKSHVANILGDTAMLQTPNVAKKPNLFRWGGVVEQT